MQSRCLNTDIAKSTFPAPHIADVRGESLRCCSGYSLVLCIINAELTTWLRPPPRLTINKYYVSRDSIAFTVILSLSCPRAFRLPRNGSSRAVFVAFGFSEAILSLPLSIAGEVFLLGYFP